MGSGHSARAYTWRFTDYCLGAAAEPLHLRPGQGGVGRLTLSLYCSTTLEQTQVDHWLTFTLGLLTCESELANAILSRDIVLQPATWLVEDTVSVADYEGDGVTVPGASQAAQVVHGLDDLQHSITALEHYRTGS